jgi:serine/threonine protein kinase
MIIGRKFALIRRMASGGVGSVYEAQDLLVRRRVALKLLNPEYAHMPEVTRRFLREARASGAVSHPNLVTVLEMGRRQDGSYYIAQELVRGTCLRDHLAACGRLDAEHALDIMVPVMSALSAAHRRGVVHRDVKPDNIVVSTGPNGEMLPKLVDFGAAKVVKRRAAMPTQVGVLLGTPNYMAPEQVRGAHDVDSRCDIWSVAVVISELVSGRMLFTGTANAPAVTYGQILHQAPERITAMLDDLPTDLGVVLAGALRPDPDDRYPTMSAFRRELLALGDGGVATSKQTPIPTASDDSGERYLEPGPLEESWDGDEESEGPKSRRVAMESQHPDSPELALSSGKEKSGEPTLEDKARTAEQALGRNALQLAIATADEVLEDASDELRPRMWLVMAVGKLWLGMYADCEQAAQSAMEAFEPQTTGWYVALGYAATARGTLGKSDELGELVEAIEKEPDEPNAARDVAACRLAIMMLRSGHREAAERLVAMVQDSPHSDQHSLVCAWRKVVCAELATHAGDVSVYLAHTEAATEHFTFAGDVRNACLQWHNYGNALMQLGAYARAEIVFREVLDLAEPMQLNLVPGALANLGFTLSRIGALDTAWQVESEALRRCGEQGNRRFEAVASIYLALILAMQRDLEAAVQLARAGVTLAATSPPTLAQAHAVLSAMLLLRDESAEALVEARKAMELLERLGGVEEGEALIRLMLMSALAREGDTKAACAAAREARDRLELRGDRIANPSWRRSFLNDVPEHARTLELAAQWLDEQRDSQPLGVALVRNTLLGLGGPPSEDQQPARDDNGATTQPGVGQKDEDQD